MSPASPGAGPYGDVSILSKPFRLAVSRMMLVKPETLVTSTGLPASAHWLLPSFPQKVEGKQQWRYPIVWLDI